MKLAVVIVSYNTCQLLQNCLASLQSAQRRAALEMEVVVVDNASVDGSAAMVAADFPAVTLLALEENVGFTGGNNRALAHLGFRAEAADRTATPAFVLLLNPDTEIIGDALERLLAVMQADPGVGVCGAHLSYGDGRFQHGAFGFPTLWQILLDLFPLSGVRGMHRLHASRVNGRYPMSLWDGTDAFAVDFVLGAALLVRGAAIHEVGLLDDGYFMYCEEMDWCLRMHQAGWGVVAAPEARILHHEGRSSRQTPWLSFERLWRSRFRFYAKHSDHFPRGYGQCVRGVVYSSLQIRRWLAQRDFARGRVYGDELARELSAYRTVLESCRWRPN